MRLLINRNGQTSPVGVFAKDRSGPKSKSATPDAPEVPDRVGGPSRTRTLDPLIKSQLLYQLS